MTKRSPVDRGFISPELLMTTAILIGLIGIVIVVLIGVTTREERTRQNDELAIVQSAIIIFMDQRETDTIIPRPKSSANVIKPTDSDAPFKTYMRSLPTFCTYYWTVDGEATQSSCP